MVHLNADVFINTVPNAVGGHQSSASDNFEIIMIDEVDKYINA